MARPLRLEFPGAIYHITSRGDRQEAIYEGDADRQQWLEILSRVCERYNWRIHAYCLMGNHYHILLETADGNLSQGMRQLNGVYTQYFNRQHNRVGHVYQGRYKAILVEKDSYLLELSRYVVLNPVRAGMIKNMDEWHWSSYLVTIGKLPPPDWLEVDWLLSQFSLQRNRARSRYIDFVREGIGLPPVWDDLRQQIYLGSDDFIDKHQKLISRKQDLDDIPALQKRAMPKPISYYQKKYKNEKQAITQAFLSGGYTLKEIGDYYGKHYTTISRIVKQNE
ncbi:MAG: transposase [Gammaproteobacteria bacterium]|nr:transposase [Gammaproteobacteria bacterium]